MKLDSLLEKSLAKTDFDAPTKAEHSVRIIKRLKAGNRKATLIFVPWQSGLVMQKWIMKQVPKSRDVYSISPRSLLLKDPQETTKQCLRVCEQATKEVQKILKQNNYNEFNVVGLSVGTGVAAYVANRIDGIKGIDLICPGAELSTALWQGSRTKALRRSYEEQGFDLEQIHKMWARVDLINNLDFSKKTSVRVTYSKSDTVIVPEQTKKVVAALENNHTPKLKTKKNRFLGHYFTMFWVWLNWRTVYHSGEIK